MSKNLNKDATASLFNESCKAKLAYNYGIFLTENSRATFIAHSLVQYCRATKKCHRIRSLSKDSERKNPASDSFQSGSIIPSVSCTFVLSSTL